jgi:hypothetical protein
VSSVKRVARSTIGRWLKDLDAAPLAAGRECSGSQPMTERD